MLLITKHSLYEHKFKFLENPPNGTMLAIPTANIWSANDELKCVVSAKLSALCDQQLNVNVTHSSSGIPNASHEAGVINAVHTIRKIVDIALSAH
jgi:hypothetical protein